MSVYKKYTLLIHENGEDMMNAPTMQNILNDYFQNNEEDCYANTWVLEAKSEEVDGPSLD
tara:strand:- start:18711 stop:18890 length:180 start_codon:yes stop_codon:yes gene_type:complete